MKEAYSKAIVSLLKKQIVEKNSPVWKDIVTYQDEIQNYLSTIGLFLIIKQDDGFAYVKQEAQDDEHIYLIPRKTIGWEMSIVLIVLRQILEDYDNNPIETQSMDKIINHREIKDEIYLFLPEKYDKVKLEKDLDNYIKRIVELGYLKELDSSQNEKRYRIHRIIKEKITFDDLNRFKRALEEYVGKL